jgi:cellulose synthase/poly-beta-1,6-N-acetylglucosamine synthase-like glycosyltransferase
VRAAPQISVVVTCLNQGAVLERALRSIGCSSCPVEVVVIDDASTDETAEVLATFETSLPLRVLRQQSLTGLAAARNRGLRESRGEYIVFLDAEDRLVPGALDLGATLLSEHPDCAFVFGRCAATLRTRALQTGLHPRIVRDHYRELLRHNSIGHAVAAMFRREVLERAGGFNPQVNGAADYELYLHVARHYPVYDHGAVVAQCRDTGTAMGSAADLLRETLEVLWAQRPFLEGDEASLAAYADGQRVWQEYYGAQLAEEIRSAAREHEWLTALTKAAVLAEYHPRGFWHHLARKGDRVLKGMRPEPSKQQLGARG